MTVTRQSKHLNGQILRWAQITSNRMKMKRDNGREKSLESTISSTQYRF